MHDIWGFNAWHSSCVVVYQDYFASHSLDAPLAISGRANSPCHH